MFSPWAVLLIGVLFLVDRFKRKTIIIYGFAIMATLHLIIAAVDYTLVGDLKATAIWLLGALFVGVMQGSMGFITWVVLAELFPLKFRGLSMGISVFFHVDHERGGQLSVPAAAGKTGPWAGLLYLRRH